MEILAGFIVGLLGSLHCVGMCGPLVMALPLTASDKKNVVLSSLTYNFGRTMTYATMGLIMGSLGWCISLGGSQKIFSIVLGGLLIYSGLCYYYPALKLNSVLPLNKVKTFLYDKLFKNFNLNNQKSAFGMGMVNGLLPCGLVYIALATSVTLGSPGSSFLYMFFFGLGTIPLMTMLIIGGAYYKNFALKFRKLLPLMLILLGLYLVYRGFALTLIEDPADLLAGVVKMSCH